MDTLKVFDVDKECDGVAVFDIVKCSLCTQPCVSREVGLKLRDCGLKCTRQRIELGRLLFSERNRHFTADMLHGEAKGADLPISLATVYNTLQHFERAGLIRRLATGGNKAWFDTNVSEHHHLYHEEDQKIVDVPDGYITVNNLPPAPQGLEIDRVDVVIHLKRSDSAV